MWTLMNTKLLSILAHLLSTGALGCHEVLLLPQTSNWTAHYRGWTSLLNISKHLRQLAEDLDGEPFAGHWQKRFDGVEDLARKTIALILNEDFWLDLRRLCTILRPLAIAASWTQMSSSSSPDRVLLTLRWLAQQYHDMPLRVYSGVHIEGVNFIRSSIDRIWSNCDQDLYLAAFALHPFHRVQAKKKDTELLALVSEEHHIALFTRLYARLMGQNPPAAFLEDVRKWITGHYPDRLADIEKHTRSVQRDAKIKGRYPDAAEIFRRTCPEPLSAFEFFAFRVLSVPAIVPLFTSAKSEAFSTQLYPFVRRGQMSAIIQRTVARSRLGPVLSRAPRLSAVLPAVPGALEDVLLRTNFVPLPKNPGKGMVRLREHLAYRSVTLQRDFGPALEHGFKEEMAWYDLLALGSQPSPFFDLESGDMDFASDAESDDELCDESEPDSSSDGDVWETESESSD
ncbi:hypothetical protein FA95DRAFT_503993 [Auriscalpium vulgare]|uniref:Uncharacterized protein n=1 Tax=Auriscalpium vulgare TaxID=40419 RepID=A0ACB8RFW2_9AGAM|nr:hypothetical protein FA95DRAFT_503993 [Auriscalpium vulgare]